MNVLVEFLRELVHGPRPAFARSVVLLTLLAVIALCVAVTFA